MFNKRWFFLMISLLPFLILAVFVYKNGRNVPFADQWFGSYYVAYDVVEGTVTPATLYHPAGGHRIVFTHALTALLVYFADWDIRLELYSSLILAFLIFMLWVDLARRDFPDFYWLGALPISALVFSLRQHMNWLWGYQTCWFFVLFFSTLTLWILRVNKVGWKPLMGSAFTALCATFSLGSGLIIWFATPLMLVMLGYRQKKHFLFWAGAAFFSMLLYISITPLKTVSGGNQPIQMLGGFIGYMLGSLGSPFVPEERSFINFAVYLGAFSLLVYLVNIFYLLHYRPELPRMATWIAASLFSYGSIYMIAAARAFNVNKVPESVLITRYVTLEQPHWLGLIGIMSLVILHIWNNSSVSAWGTWLLRTNLILLVSLSGLYLYTNYTISMKPPLVTAVVEECLQTYPTTGNQECLKSLAPSEDEVGTILNQVEWLAEVKLSLFAE